MDLPSFRVYCDNTTGQNALAFDLGPIEVFYSYQTPVAFHTVGDGLVVRQNDWGRTTGKHMNAIDGGCRKAKARRLPSAEFEARLRARLDPSERLLQP